MDIALKSSISSRWLRAAWHLKRVTWIQLKFMQVLCSSSYVDVACVVHVQFNNNVTTEP